MGEPRKLLTRTRLRCSSRVSQWTPRGKLWLDLLTRRVVVRVEHTPYRGYCVRSVYPRGGSQLDRLFVVPPPEFSVKRIQLQQQAAGNGPTHLAAVESNIFAALPNLVAHCCVTRYEDGSVRQPGWWTLKTRGAAWVCQVKDPDSCCSLQAAANSVDDALALADLLLGTENAPWEADAFLKQQKKK